ncbi:hypothetical protein EXM22_10280 [Oceanispirochaeta crateris]|uniref:Enoyl reductase (ER) domain-containing protein n=1 Tax=Oceanispirochaeta crateris TaxID=2518645 RepID=A0A5C1QP64_9SPIO|nr:alcohol dehydrogenase catalytic domain-containing protein [Oceanispirochaeta crateris]QEN08356.1 hypothetical protein EXM22_10280 [Oceanispirochaeta crateris]
MYKSAWVSKKKEIKIIEKAHHVMKSHDVRVKIQACGVCGTDIHFYNENPGGKTIPLGHEVAGVVEELGSETTGLRVGDKVVIQNHVACGRCTSCLNQKPQACTDIFTYMNDQSGMGEYLTVPEKMVLRYEGLEPWEATVAEPITVALDLCKQADIPLNCDVLIMGPGIIGLSCIKLAQKRGARNIVLAGRNFNTERGSGRKKAAESLGATHTVDTSITDWKMKLKENFPNGFDRVIVTSPPNTIADAIELAGFGADIIYNGISFSSDSISLSANDLHFQKKNLKTSHAIPNWGFPIALDLLRNGDIDPSVLVSARIPFIQLEEALREAQKNDRAVIKVVVEI